MKKNLFLSFLFVLTVMFTGCNIFDGNDYSLYYQMLPKTYSTPEGGDYIVTAVNYYSAGIPIDYAPYAVTENNRSLESAECELEFFNENRRIDAQFDYKKILDELNNSNCRSADSDYKYYSGFSPDGLKVGEKTKVGMLKYVDGEQKFLKEECTLEYEGNFCKVFFVNNAPEYISEQKFKEKKDFENLGKKFDEIYSIETAINGADYITKDSFYCNGYKLKSISGHKKINIIVGDCYFDCKETIENGYGSAGYFYILDLAQISEGYDYGYTNSSEMIFVDSYFLDRDISSSYSVLVHEFNHLLNTINMEINNNSGDLETWYTEMLSGITEAYCSPFLGLEIKNSRSVYSQRLPYFYRFYNLGFGNWRNSSTYSDSDVFISYGNAVTFGLYLVHNYGGFELMKNLCNSNYSGEQAVTEALRKCGYSLNFNDVMNNFAYLIINVNDDSSMPSLANEIYYNKKTYPDIKLEAIKHDFFYSGIPQSNPRNSNGQMNIGQYGFTVLGKLSTEEKEKFTIYECAIYPTTINCLKY